MALNPLFVIAPSLEMYFVDKTTGLPLAGGTVEFFSDVNRSLHKAVYTISGSPPNYSYVQLPNPSVLSGTGTFQDAGGNNVLPYYYPYDVDGNIELYYIKVKDSNDLTQLTREAWPNITPSSTPSIDEIPINFIANGQFLLHDNIPADPLNNIPAGQITDPVTAIGQNDWFFLRPSSSTATDNVSFFRYGSYVTNPTSSPRYSVQVQCLGADPSDAYKNLGWRTGDVNKFSSDTQQYTFAFNAITFNSGNFDVNVLITKYYGTDGSPSPTTITQIATFTITNIEQLFQIPFVFGSNTGTQVGTNDDDYVEIDISFPTNISFGAQLTDFMLQIGDVIITEFPVQTNSDMIIESLSPPIPDPNGFDLYLPLILTPSGTTYDQSQVGKIVTSFSTTPKIGELPCDGSQYYTNGYSADGIPYARLQQELWVPQLNSPMFGTGTNFAFASISSSNNFFLATNVAGAQTFTVDGAIPTGFTFTTVVTGHTDYGFITGMYNPILATTLPANTNSVWIINETAGVCPAPSAGTSALTLVCDVNQLDGTRKTTGNTVSSANTVQIVALNNIGSIPVPGSYLNIATPTVQYYVWFKENGVGSDPLQPGTGIVINNLSSFIGGDVAYNIQQALMGHQCTIIGMLGGSSIPAGSYFIFFAGSQQYYVWYNLNGNTPAPIGVSGIGIPVVYNMADSVATIYLETLRAINSTYYATPDLRGFYLKGCNFTSGTDLNINFRYSSNSRFLCGDNLGTYEFDTLLSHTHSVPVYMSGSVATQQIDVSNPSTTLVTTGALMEFAGTSQNDVKNVYVNYFIKY